MNKSILFGGAVVMLVLGLTIGGDMPAQASVGLGLMWLGLASK